MNRTQMMLGAILIILVGLIPAFSQETPKISSAESSVLTRRALNGASVTPVSCATDDLCEQLQRLLKARDALDKAERLATLATDDLCEQRLLKALDALDKAERLVTALEAENAALRRLNAVNEQILTAKETVISEQIKLIEIYKKQSGRKISFLFGLVKIRY